MDLNPVIMDLAEGRPIHWSRIPWNEIGKAQMALVAVGEWRNLDPIRVTTLAARHDAFMSGW